jgi:cell division protein FtsB
VSDNVTTAERERFEALAGESAYYSFRRGNYKARFEFPKSLAEARGAAAALRCELSHFDDKLDRKLAAKDDGHLSEEEFDEWQNRWQSARAIHELRIEMLDAWASSVESTALDADAAAALVTENTKLRQGNEYLLGRVSDLKKQLEAAVTRSANILANSEDLLRANEALRRKTSGLSEHSAAKKLENVQAAFTNLLQAHTELKEKLKQANAARLEQGSAIASPLPPRVKTDGEIRAKSSLHETFCKVVALYEIMSADGRELPTLFTEFAQRCLESIPSGMYQRWCVEDRNRWIAAYATEVAT